MVQAGISRDIVSASVAKSELEFRHGHGDLFVWLENEGVPLLLFSAGIAGKGSGRNLIAGVLAHRDTWHCLMAGRCSDILRREASIAVLLTVREHTPNENS